VHLIKMGCVERLPSVLHAKASLAILDAIKIGEVLEHFPDVDGVLTMHDEGGKATGKRCRLGPDDDERVLRGSS
jgi:hypothetical protein